MVFKNWEEFACSSETMGLVGTPGTKNPPVMYTKNIRGPISIVFRMTSTSSTFQSGMLVGFSFLKNGLPVTVSTSQAELFARAAFLEMMRTQQDFLWDSDMSFHEDSWKDLNVNASSMADKVREEVQTNKTLLHFLFLMEKGLCEGAENPAFKIKYWPSFDFLPIDEMNKAERSMARLAQCEKFVLAVANSDPYTRETKVAALMKEMMELTPNPFIMLRWAMECCKVMKLRELPTQRESENIYRKVKNALSDWPAAKSGLVSVTIKTESRTDKESYNDLNTFFDRINSYGIATQDQSDVFCWSEVLSLKSGNKILYRRTN